MDGFGARHSMGSATWNGKTVMFFGQDVIQGKCFNHLYNFDNEKCELEKLEYLKADQLKPKKRNSQSSVQVGSKAYIYGGANDEGPLNDALELDLETMKFKYLKIANPTEAPYFEMHTAHVYQGKKMLLIGGRSHVLPT